MTVAEGKATMVIKNPTPMLQWGRNLTVAEGSVIIMPRE